MASPNSGRAAQEAPTSDTAAVVVVHGNATARGNRMQVVIRAATEADVDAVISFEQGLAQETEGKQLDDACIRRGVLVPLSKPYLARIFVAVHPEDPSKYVGFMTIGTQWTEWRGGFMHWILSTFVNSEYRGAGVFSQLYNYVKATVIADRLSVGMRLYVERANERAQKTYKKLGMEVEDYVMFKWMKRDHDLPAKVSDDVPHPPETPIRPAEFPTHNGWSIRLADAADLPTLVQLQLDNAKEGHDLTLRTEDLRRGVAMPWAERNLARMYVAEVEGKVVGVLMVTNEWSEWKGGIVYWLTSIYVRPEFRNRGILTSMFEFAKAQVEREPNSVGFRMQVRSANTKGRRLAEKLGMAEEPYYLMRWMDPQGAVVSRPHDGSLSPMTQDRSSPSRL
jgi:GNAT superfamily N-acetyltransferase